MRFFSNTPYRGSAAHTRRLPSSGHGNRQHSEVLDGLRGLAAASVVLSHIFMLYLSEIHNGQAHNGASALALSIFHSPFTFFYRGGAAVLLFFLLSGYVLYAACLRKAPYDDTYVPVAASKRYIRLGLPVAASICIAYVGIAMHAFPAASTGVNAFLDFPDASLGFGPMLQSALYSSMLFGDGRFNYVLWTISIEFYGSLLIFSLYALTGKNKAVSGTLCLGTACYLLSLPKAFSVYGMFLFGAALAHVDFRTHIQRLQRYRTPLAIALWITGCYLAGFHQGSAAYGVLTPATLAMHSQAPHADASIVYPAIGALFILTGTLISMSGEPSHGKPGVSRRILAWLGKLSFSVYLLHPLILASVGNYLFLETGNTPRSLLLCLTLVFSLSYTLAYFFYRYIDKPSMQLADWFGKQLFPAPSGKKPQAA